MLLSWRQEAKISCKLLTLQSLLYHVVLSACVFPHIIQFGISGARVLLVNPTRLPRCAHDPCDLYVEGIMMPLFRNTRTATTVVLYSYVLSHPINLLTSLAVQVASSQVMATTLNFRV